MANSNLSTVYLKRGRGASLPNADMSPCRVTRTTYRLIFKAGVCGREREREREREGLRIEDDVC